MRPFKIDFSRHLPIYVVLLLAAFLSSCSIERSGPPNILVFLVDDLGYMDIGANNPDSFYETPHIDGLADSGMLFTDGYAANPVCSPTRYALMTGKHPTRADATNFFSGKRSGKFDPAPLVDNMPLKEVTVAEVLKEAGYRTFFAGK
ncbi:MAG: sulfatase, partial [Gammaproteobacteria bacterium]|nr:sulfatase [Gammaproteobacteria bacterium]